MNKAGPFSKELHPQNPTFSPPLASRLTLNPTQADLGWVNSLHDRPLSAEPSAETRQFLGSLDKLASTGTCAGRRPRQHSSGSPSPRRRPGPPALPTKMAPHPARPAPLPLPLPGPASLPGRLRSLRGATWRLGGGTAVQGDSAGGQRRDRRGWGRVVGLLGGKWLRGKWLRGETVIGMGNQHGGGEPLG